LSRATIKTVGLVPDDLLQLFEAAGYRLKAYPDAIRVTTDQIEGPEPLLLADIGVHTAYGIVRGLQQDIPATQRFFVWDLDDKDANAAATYRELRILIDFSQAINRSLARTETADAAVRFLAREAGAEAVAVHYWSPEVGVELGRAAGFDRGHLTKLGAMLAEVVRPDNLAFRKGVTFADSPRSPKPAVPLSAIVPIVAKDELIGALSLRTSPREPISVETLKAMGRLAGVSMHNALLLERSEAHRQSLRAAEQSVTQAEKLAAVGMLAAGIAHEINNPASYIITNLTMLEEYVADLLGFADAVGRRLVEVAPESAEWLARERSARDVDYLTGDVPELIGRCLGGMARIREIVQDLRTFSHRGTGEAEWVDANQAISQVLKLAGPELRHRARVELDLRPVPLVRLESNRLVQVLLNLIINAYQAFGDRPRIENAVWVSSAWLKDSIRLVVSDNGPGVPEEARDRIFEPFYTTKPVGSGTGLGLAISYEIVKSLGGELRLELEPGRGAVFAVELALRSDERPDGLEWEVPSSTAGSSGMGSAGDSGLGSGGGDEQTEESEAESAS
jgi:signal transduction histidine kinase